MAGAARSGCRSQVEQGKGRMAEGEQGVGAADPGAARR